jgi:polyphosphate glucokinase
MQTLCVDIGGTGIKGLVVDDRAEPVTDRRRIETPDPAVPEAVLDVIRQIAEGQTYDRVSAGFPGVVEGGVVRTAPNLGPGWADFPLARRLEELLGRPARVANDAGVQGLAVIEGKGTEIVLTLGTGMGFALYIDGRYVPNIELAHHPFRNRKTYEERVSDAELKRIGTARWKRRVRKIVDQIGPIFNFRRMYLGGGNARLLDPSELPENVTVIDNVAGMLGGVRLWDDAARPAAPGPKRKARGGSSSTPTGGNGSG